MEDKKVLNLLSEEQILMVLRECGAEPIRYKDNEIWFETICHHGSSHKLCYFRDSKDFYCYTNCGKMSLISLLSKIKKLTPIEVIFSLNNRFGRKGLGLDRTESGKSVVDFNNLNKYANLRSKEKEKKELKKLEPIDENILNYYDNNIFYKGWVDEGISFESMEKFGIRWYGCENHIIIPHRDEDGNLVGIRRRSLKPEDSKDKYMPVFLEGKSYAHPLMYNLYGLYENRKEIEKIKKVIIVEGEKSVLLSDTYYGNKSYTVATCGFNVSEWQVMTLLNMGVEEVIIGFDKDFNDNDFLEADPNSEEYKEYWNFVKRIYSLAFKFSSYCKVYVLWDKNDLLNLKDSPFDRGKEVLEELLKNKIQITTEMKGADNL